MGDRPPDPSQVWACDRTEAGCRQRGGRAGAASRAASGAETRAAGAAKPCDRGWMGAAGSWGSRRRWMGGTCRAGGDVAGAVVDMDRGSAGSAGRCRGGDGTEDGAGSFGSSDQHATEGSHGPGD